MAKTGPDCVFISARHKDNIEGFRRLLYERVRYLHVQKYPYNDFLYPISDD
jgi:GTP-binding protein HflX